MSRTGGAHDICDALLRDAVSDELLPGAQREIALDRR